MVVAEGVRDERCQAARPTEGHCRVGSPAGGDHASHLARRHEFRWTRQDIMLKALIVRPDHCSLAARAVARQGQVAAR